MISLAFILLSLLLFLFPVTLESESDTVTVKVKVADTSPDFSSVHLAFSNSLLLFLFSVTLESESDARTRESESDGRNPLISLAFISLSLLPFLSIESESDTVTVKVTDALSRFLW